jgi:tetratricopeptide (TPR) repeat protein
VADRSMFSLNRADSPRNKNQAEELGEHGQAQQPGTVLLQGKILIERTAFVGHSFADADFEVVNFFRSLLGEMGVQCISGEKAEANTVGEKVKKRILEAEIFVGIFTQRDKIEGKDEWRASEWLIEEKTFAAANGKKLILLKEKGVTDIGGLQGDLEYIEFVRDTIHTSAIKLLQIIWSLNPGKITFGSNQRAEMSLEVLEAAVMATPKEPGLRVMLAQQKVAKGQIAAALRDLDSVLDLYPDFVPALHEKVKGLRSYGRKEDARKIVDKLLTSNPSDAMGHHQLAHILDDAGDTAGALDAYKRAEDCAPGDACHFLCHGKLLFRTARNNRRSLDKARKVLKVATDLGGPKIKKDLAGHFLAIKKRLAKLPKDKKAGKKRRSR